MTDTTPASSTAHKAESLTEQQMRSDSMHSYLLGNAMANTKRDGMER